MSSTDLIKCGAAALAAYTVLKASKNMCSDLGCGLPGPSVQSGVAGEVSVSSVTTGAADESISLGFSYYNWRIRYNFINIFAPL